MTSATHDQDTGDHPVPSRLFTRPLISVTVTAFVFFLYIGMVLVILPRYIEEELGAGEFGIGLAVASFAVAAIAARPFLGRLTERYGRRALMIAGAVIAGSAGAVTGLATTLWQLLVLRGFMGLGEAALFVGASTLLADLSPPHRRAEAASYFSVAVFGGIGVGPLIGEWVLQDDRYTLTFLVAGVFSLAAALTVMGVPARVDRTSRSDAGGRPPLFHRAALWPGVVLASGIAGFSVFAAFIPDHARVVGLAGASGLFLVYSVISMSLRVFGAKLPERIGVHRMVTVALVSLAAGLSLLALIPEIWAVWVSAGLIGLGMSFMYPSLMATVVDQVSERERASALSSFTMFFEVGTIFGGVVLGGVGELLSKRAGFFGGAVFCVAGLVVLWQLLSTSVTIADPDRRQPVPA